MVIQHLVDVALPTRRECSLDLVPTVDELSDGVHDAPEGTARRYVLHVRVAGLAVNIPTRGRPVVRLVVLDDATGTAEAKAAEEISTDAVAITDQLFHVARSIESRVRGLAVDRVIVRRADVPTRASKKEGPRLRLLVEGAVVSAARGVVIDTRLGMGKDIAHWHGSVKSDLDDAAAQLMTTTGKHAKFAEAAGAALAGLALP